MRPKPSVIAATAIAVVLVACTSNGATGPKGSKAASINRNAAAADIVLLGTQHGTVAVRPATDSVLTEGSGTVTAAYGSRLYSATPRSGHTTLLTTDAATGAVTSRTSIDGRLDVRAISVSGRAAAMMEPLPKGVDSWTPVPRARTEIVVADPTGSRAPRPYDLTGNFEPDAFSIDDTRLFLIQYLPAEAPTVYRVTVLDLAAGRVHNVHGRFKTAPERMPGIRLRQVLDPQVGQLYTLYTTKPHAYTPDYGGWGSGGAPETFVHVLNLRDGWAYCAGLPKRFWGEPASAQAMAVSPNGELLYVVDSMRDAVTVMNTRSLEILRTARVELGSLSGVRTSAQVSADGGTLFVGSASDGSAVYAIDTTTFGVMHRWTMPAAVSGLGLSADGLRLYVALQDGVAGLDAATGEQLTAVSLPGVDSILHVGAVRA